MDMMERRGGKKLQHPDMEKKERKGKERHIYINICMYRAERTYRKKEMKKE